MRPWVQSPVLQKKKKIDKEIYLAQFWRSKGTEQHWLSSGEDVMADGLTVGAFTAGQIT
jgi:hypothetical protein